MNELNEVIESYNAYIKNVATGTLKIAEHLRKDEVAQALSIILDFSEGMSWLIDANEAMKQNAVEVALEVQDIQDFLAEINEGLEMQDYVLVADLFEYEIAPYFEQLPNVEASAN